MEGYDAHFDPPLDKRLECPICLLAQREPMQTPCGHRFCSTCILRALRETGPRCPVDKTRVSNRQLFRDNFAKREVLSLNVKCLADEDGCSWHGELRKLESHVKLCDLVIIECPNYCGHTCQRKEVSPHLATCINKPEQCKQCSVYFTRNKIPDHLPHCSRLILPESIQSNLLKANNVLKWCGHFKLKITSPYSSMFNKVPNSIFQVSGYLTAKVDSPESVMFTGNWTSSLSLMPVNSSSAKVFWRMLHGPEVQTKTFGFGLINNDSASSMFSKVLKRKLNDLSAIVGLHLKSGPCRTDLTIIYLHWSEPKQRLMACVAELKSHLVKQMQNRLHLQQQISSRRGRNISPEARAQSHSRSQTRNSVRSLQQLHQQSSPTNVPPRHIQHQHIHPRVHPRHPTAAVALVTPGLGPQPYQQQHHSHHVQEAHSRHHHILPSQLQQASAQQQSSIGHPRILSWQMSQSLNGYPWRVQTGNVPFFTFPSTPPSFLPANSYPYTFAPVPPFSINQIAQVPTTAVPVPSYAGIAVPQVSGVDSIVTGPGGTPFHVAALPSLTEVTSEHMHNIPAGTVAVTLANANSVPGQPAAATVVIQQSVIPSNQDSGGLQNQDMAVIHTIAPPPPPPHANYHTSQIPAHMAPAIISTDGNPAARVIQNHHLGGDAVSVRRFHGPIVAALSPQLITMGTPQQPSVVGLPADPAVSVANANLGHIHHTPGYLPSHSDGRSEETSHSNIDVYNDGAGPSRIIESGALSDDSSTSNSPSRNFASMFYGSRPFNHFYNDSDDSSDNRTEIESSDLEAYPQRGDRNDLSEERQVSSDLDDSFSQSDSELDSPTDPSTLRMIASSPITVDTHGEVGLTSDETSVEDSNSLSLPVLINISDSDSGNSRVVTPTSLIDLTSSSSPPIASTSHPFPPSNQVHVPSGVLNSVPYNEINTSDGPVFVPIINQHSTGIRDMETQIIAHRETSRYYDVAMPTQRPALISDLVASTPLSQDTNHSSRPVVQMTQLHPHDHSSQIYANHGHVAPSHRHILQQSRLRNNHLYHSHQHDSVAQSVYPNYSTPNLSTNNGAIEVQQISTLQAVPIDTPGAPMPVLSWQQPAGHQPYPGDMAVSHRTPQPDPSSGFTSHHGIESTVIPIHQQRTVAGNFWETVMPSLDITLQGNASEATRP